MVDLVVFEILKTFDVDYVDPVDEVAAELRQQITRRLLDIFEKNGSHLLLV